MRVTGVVMAGGGGGGGGGGAIRFSGRGAAGEPLDRDASTMCYVTPHRLALNAEIAACCDRRGCDVTAAESRAAVL